MGLFVVGRLAAQHGLVVRLRSTVASQPDSGTTAGVYIPAGLLLASTTRPEPAVETVQAVEESRGRTELSVPEPPVESWSADLQPAGLLPQRRPGASGITGPEDPVEAIPPAAAPPRSDVAAFFAPRPQPAEGTGRARHARHADTSDDDAIYQKMLSEWLVDPHELSHSADLNWQSVWDHGWSAAAAAETEPVHDHTAEGLPVRLPGARLVPGAPGENGVGSGDVNGVASGAHAARDPDAVRVSIASHLSGVHAGRRRAQEQGGAETR